MEETILSYLKQDDSLLVIIVLIIFVMIIILTIHGLAQGKKVTLFRGFIVIGGKSHKKKPVKTDKNKLDSSYEISFLGSISNSFFYIRREDYYKKYLECVSNAKESVYMIGDGFACHDNDNDNYAEGLIDAIESALKNGAKVHRFQYNTTLSLKWLHLLLKLKNNYSEKFFLYMHKEYDPIILPYVICLVDDKHDTASINVMFTSLSDTSLEEKTAGPAFIFEKEEKIVDLMIQMKFCVNDFFNANYSQAHPDINKLYNSLKNTRKDKIRKYFDKTGMIEVDETSLRMSAKKLDILDVNLVLEVALDELSNQDRLYFAYGSNLFSDRLHERCASAEFAEIGYIDNHELIFNIMGTKGEGKNGGVANIVKSVGHRVYGALYKIDREELVSLNELEKSMSYKVIKEEIHTAKYSKVLATVYINDANSITSIYAPTSAYKKLIINGMKQRGFDEDYQKDIIRKMNS